MESENPVDAGRKWNVDVQKTSRMSSERLMYVQFTSCVSGEVTALKIHKLFISSDKYLAVYYAEAVIMKRLDTGVFL